MVNYVSSPIIMRPNVIGTIVPGILYLVSTNKGLWAKILQVILTFSVGALSVLANDPNSFIPVIVLSVVILLSNKYFPKVKILIFLYAVPYIGLAFYCGWGPVQLLNNVLLYILHTTVFYIITNDKV